MKVMSVLKTAALLLASIGCVSGEVLYSRSHVPAPWKLASSAPAGSKVTFTLALKQRNLDILDKWFHEASEPTHPNYQSYKSIDEIRDLVSPVDADKSAVWDWLHSAGIHHYHARDMGDALEITTTAAKAAQLFDTQLSVFEHRDTGAKLVRAWGDYSVPASVRPHIDMVSGLSTFPGEHFSISHPNAANDYGVTPKTVFQQYGVSQQSSDKFAASQGVIEFEGQYFSPSNLQQFGQLVNEKVKAVPANQTIGKNDASQPGDEAELDIQLVAGVNLGASNWFWIEDESSWVYEFSTHYFNTKEVPQIGSISYGWWEADQCENGIGGQECQQLGVDSARYVQRVNTEFQKIALRGLTLLVSSGDSGANGRTDPQCTVAQLRPTFPAGSPYVTAVGATELVNVKTAANPDAICTNAGLDCASSGTEQAVSYAISGFAAGGGFSNITARPDWQKAAVQAYLTGGAQLPTASYFNASGRAYPDIAAFGHNLMIYTNGNAEAAGGTSASSPIVAAILSLLNVASVEATGDVIGFANPLLYKMAADCPQCFTDITVGDNKCTEQGCADSCQGFVAAKGWDPVTGLGTPKLTEMIKYIKSKQHLRK